MSYRPHAPRVVALVGPYGSGKTSLLESLLSATGALTRKGSVNDKTSFGDSTPEARQHLMSVETNIVSLTWQGDDWTFLDSPGSVEFPQDSRNALQVADLAVLVVEPVPERAIMAAPLLKTLDAARIPHLLFINKVDANDVRLTETLAALQAVSDRPLLLREMPIRENGSITGFIDLISERAYRYQDGKPSEQVNLPDDLQAEEQLARQEVLEHLADFDDTLLEELLSDVPPPADDVWNSLEKEIARDQVVPVLFGSATQDHGIRRLLKALRHDTPGPDITAARLGIEEKGAPLAQIFKTIHAPHTGKLSYARIWRGSFTDGAPVNGQRPSALLQSTTGGLMKQGEARTGQVIAFARLEGAVTGTALGAAEDILDSWPEPLPPLFALSVAAARKADDVKLSAAVTRLVEEDPSLSFAHDHDTGEWLLRGQGDIHLQVALEKLKSRAGLDIVSQPPQVPYKETIRLAVSEHGRHKRQSGGHGQFGDVTLEIAPQERGAGFTFIDKIVGGVVPRQYIPAVEDGAIETLKQGPLGFPVVDLSVALVDGTYHAVDSSDQAFKAATRLALLEGLNQAEPVLLEPVLKIEVAIPNDCTAKAQRIVTGRRGQILGFEARNGWDGWDVVTAWLPQAEVNGLIVELRSLTMGVGTFAASFDHLAELTGRQAEKVIADRKVALAAR